MKKGACAAATLLEGEARPSGKGKVQSARHSEKHARIGRACPSTIHREIRHLLDSPEIRPIHVGVEFASIHDHQQPVVAYPVVGLFQNAKLRASPAI